MANDPYWNNTALLLHGDITGDPQLGVSDGRGRVH